MTYDYVKDELDWKKESTLGRCCQCGKYLSEGEGKALTHEDLVKGILLCDCCFRFGRETK